MYIDTKKHHDFFIRSCHGDDWLADITTSLIASMATTTGICYFL